MLNLFEIVNLICLIINQNVRTEMCQDDKTNFELATSCEMCDREFTLLFQKVPDHCHLNGKFRTLLCTENTM